MSVAMPGQAARGSSKPAAQVLRVLSRVLLTDLDRLAGRLVMMVLKREPSYAALGWPSYDDLHRNLRDNIERGFQSLAGEVPPDADPQDTCKRTGVLRARQGVPLEAVLRAYRLGGQVIWEALRAASRDQFDGCYDAELLDAAGYVWRVIDASSSALVDAYRKEEARIREHEVSRRHAYLSALLTGRGSDPIFAAEAAHVLGLPVQGELLCVAAPVDAIGDEPIHTPAELLSAHGVTSYWQWRSTHVVGLIALGGKPAEEMCTVLRPAVTGRVGVSAVVGGLAQLGAAYEMASTAARTLRAPGLVRFDDRLPEALLVDRPELIARLRDVAFAGLAGLAEGEREIMLATVRALLACNDSPTHAAKRLYCHRNTVIYRLHKFEQLTGHTLTHPRDRLLLNLALLADED